MKTGHLLVIVYIFGITSAVTGCETDGSAKISREEISTESLKRLWRDLANESRMSLLDMRDIPVALHAQRQLFLDNVVVASKKGLDRMVHPPQRHPGNPVLSRGSSSDAAFVLQVCQFEQSPRFRMWYWSSRRWHNLPDGQQIRFGTSYATSEDGIHWRVPKLDLYRQDGNTDRNVVRSYGLMHGLFYEPDDPDKQKKFKALVCVERRNPVVREGYYLHTSPDGIHWTGNLDSPVIPSLNSYSLPQDGIGDTSRFWWDPKGRRYVADTKFVIPGKLRARGMMFSDDLVHWTRPFPTFFARDPVTQIYGHTAFVYQGIYIGLRWIYDPRYDPQTHSMHVELDTSRDGYVWTRVGAGVPYMSVNSQRNTWDSSRIKPTAALEVDEKLWIYYAAAPTTADLANPDFPDSQQMPYSTGLATLKRDRFVSLRAGTQKGILVTRPLTFSGRYLHINAEIASGGAIHVSLLNSKGDVIPGFDRTDCRLPSGSALDYTVGWPQGLLLPGPEKGTVRLKVEMINSDLFSFWTHEQSIEKSL